MQSSKFYKGTIWIDGVDEKTLNTFGVDSGVNEAVGRIECYTDHGDNFNIIQVKKDKDIVFYFEVYASDTDANETVQISCNFIWEPKKIKQVINLKKVKSYAESGAAYVICVGTNQEDNYIDLRIMFEEIDKMPPPNFSYGESMYEDNSDAQKED